MKTANLTRSRGVALIAGLLIMGSMSLLVLAIASSVLMERRAAAGFGDARLALNRAHLGVHWGEYWLASLAENPLTTACAPDCQTGPLFSKDVLPTSPETMNGSWWKQNGIAAGIEPISGQTKMNYTLPHVEDAFWLIEEVHTEPIDETTTEPGQVAPMLSFYRIFGYGTGMRPGSVAVTESVFARPWISPFTPSTFPPTLTEPGFCDQFSEEVPCGRLSWRQRR